MCDFKPGDEVVCVDDSRPLDRAPGPYPVAGGVYKVRGFDGNGPDEQGFFGLLVDGLGHRIDPIFGLIGWRHTRFRKVQRRDLSAWLETAATDTDHLDKPIKTPARPKVDALLKRVQSGAFG